MGRTEKRRTQSINTKSNYNIRDNRYQRGTFVRMMRKEGRTMNSRFVDVVYAGSFEEYEDPADYKRAVTTPVHYDTYDEE